MRRTRLKYYLRALGIGIVVTALLMGYSQKEPAQMTDEEIRQRAAQLGMVEQQGVLSELTGATAKPQETAPPTQSAEPAATEEPQQTEEPGETQAPQQSAEPGETQAPQQSAEPGETQAPQQSAEPEADTVTLVIVRGDTSVSVSKALAEAGLVEDYQTYDRFLCSGGYDKSINPGTYEIPVDATDEEIARIITKKR